MTLEKHYKAPTGHTQRRFNAGVRWLADHGIGLAGARTLTVVGRTSGRPQSIPVNPVIVAGTTYLVAPRGTTQWVRNLRAAGRCEIRIGSRRTDHAAVEVAPGESVPVIREYIRRWGWEVNSHLPFPIATDADDEAYATLARLVPVFALD